jgi:Holliday junction resolvase
LPKSDTEALIEYTLFSKEKLKPAAYERELRAYLSEKTFEIIRLKSKKQEVFP